jgi:hypothetical protein
VSTRIRGEFNSDMLSFTDLQGDLGFRLCFWSISSWLPDWTKNLTDEGCSPQKYNCNIFLEVTGSCSVCWFLDNTWTYKTYYKYVTTINIKPFFQTCIYALLWNIDEHLPDGTPNLTERIENLPEGKFSNLTCLV